MRGVENTYPMYLGCTTSLSLVVECIAPLFVCEVLQTEPRAREVGTVRTTEWILA